MLAAHLLENERKLIYVVVETRVRERIPVPYLTGEAWFAGLPFKVDERVLIPRSPIAELIETAYQPWLGDHGVGRMMDLCCGSACIGIASALYLPEVTVDLVDISADALKVAEKNILLHGVEDRVNIIQSDLFQAVSVQAPLYDLIVANPPYVDAGDLASMPAEYRHEPELALASGEDGLELARKILVEAADYLCDDGLLILEVGNSGMTLENNYPDVPFTWIEFERGGQGVLVFKREELVRYRDLFAVQ
jgi:ribosomal protein L3 glutamine methyltransferase